MVIGPSPPSSSHRLALQKEAASSHPPRAHAPQLQVRALAVGGAGSLHLPRYLQQRSAPIGFEEQKQEQARDQAAACQSRLPRAGAGAPSTRSTIQAKNPA